MAAESKGERILESQIGAAKFAQKLRRMCVFDPNTPTDVIVQKTLEAAGIPDATERPPHDDAD